MSTLKHHIVFADFFLMVSKTKYHLGQYCALQLLNCRPDCDKTNAKLNESLDHC